VPDLMVLEGSGHQGKLSSVSQHNQGEKSTCQHKLNGLVIHVSCRINRLHGSAGLSVGGQYHSQADGESVCVPARKSKLSTRTACIKVNLAYCSSTAVLWCMLSSVISWKYILLCVVSPLAHDCLKCTPTYVPNIFKKAALPQEHSVLYLQVLNTSREASSPPGHSQKGLSYP
jgi:hypothetical protein